MKIFLLITIWILTVTIIGYLAYTGWLFWGRLQKSKDLIMHSKAFTAHGRNLQILVAGDSTAVGVGASDPRKSIAGRIHQDLPNSTLENIGQSGLRTADLVTQLKIIPTTKQYDLIVLQIGGNDTVNGTKISEIAANLNQALEQAKKLSPHVILMSSGNVGAAPIFPIPLQPFYHRRTLRVRQVFIDQAARHNVHYVDLYRPPAADPFLAQPQKYFAPDVFHPNGAGYGLWYQQVQPIVEKLRLQTKN